MRKNNGAAASIPTKLGFPFPEKSPIQTTSTYGPTTPADHASRKPHDVPVFHATGQRPRIGGCPVLIRPRIAAQHVERDERGLRTEQPRAFISFARLIRRGAHGPQHALIREHSIQAREFLHGDFAAAQRQRQPVVRFRLQPAHPGALQELRTEFGCLSCIAETHTAGTLRLRISASSAVIGPKKRPSKFSGVNGPNEVGESRRIVRGCSTP